MGMSVAMFAIACMYVPSGTVLDVLVFIIV